MTCFVLVLYNILGLFGSSSVGDNGNINVFTKILISNEQVASNSCI